MKKALAFVFAVSILVAGIPSAEAANPKAGGSCSKLNQKVDLWNAQFLIYKVNQLQHNLVLHRNQIC